MKFKFNKKITIIISSIVGIGVPVLWFFIPRISSYVYKNAQVSIYKNKIKEKKITNLEISNNVKSKIKNYLKNSLKENLATKELFFTKTKIWNINLILEDLYVSSVFNNAKITGKIKDSIKKMNISTKVNSLVRFFYFYLSLKVNSNVQLTKYEQDFYEKFLDTWTNIYTGFPSFNSKDQWKSLEDLSIITADDLDGAGETDFYISNFFQKNPLLPITIKFKKNLEKWISQAKFVYVENSNSLCLFRMAQNLGLDSKIMLKKETKDKILELKKDLLDNFEKSRSTKTIIDLGNLYFLFQNYSNFTIANNSEIVSLENKFLKLYNENVLSSLELTKSLRNFLNTIKLFQSHSFFKKQNINIAKIEKLYSYNIDNKNLDNIDRNNNNLNILDFNIATNKDLSSTAYSIALINELNLDELISDEKIILLKNYYKKELVKIDKQEYISPAQIKMFKIIYNYLRKRNLLSILSINHLIEKFKQLSYDGYHQIPSYGKLFMLLETTEENPSLPRWFLEVYDKTSLRDFNKIDSVENIIDLYYHLVVARIRLDNQKEIEQKFLEKYQKFVKKISETKKSIFFHDLEITYLIVIELIKYNPSNLEVLKKSALFSQLKDQEFGDGIFMIPPNPKSIYFGIKLKKILGF